MSKHFFKLINNEVVFGEVEAVQKDQHTEILVKTPYTARNGSIMPYMVDVMGSAPGAIQIHPMNIVWSVPLDEFPEAERVYIEATSGIVMNKKEDKKIIV